jgi:hypothetical protein
VKRTGRVLPWSFALPGDQYSASALMQAAKSPDTAAHAGTEAVWSNPTATRISLDGRFGDLRETFSSHSMHFNVILVNELFLDEEAAHVFSLVALELDHASKLFILYNRTVAAKLLLESLCQLV